MSTTVLMIGTLLLALDSLLTIPIQYKKLLRSSVPFVSSRLSRFGGSRVSYEVNVHMSKIFALGAALRALWAANDTWPHSGSNAMLQQCHTTVKPHHTR